MTSDELLLLDLETLIKMCGDNFDALHRYSNNRWGAWKNNQFNIAKQADNPKQAIINLLLLLEEEKLIKEKRYERGKR